MSTNLTQVIVTRLADLRPLCGDMRFAQVFATVGLLSEDMFGLTLWDIEDDQLLEVLERFRQDLARREQSPASS
jgi:hypothetical protein